MNFAFTKWKTIVSLIVGFLLGLYVGWFIEWLPGPIGFMRILAKLFYGIIVLAIVFAVIYIIWSLIEKKSL